MYSGATGKTQVVVVTYISVPQARKRGSEKKGNCQTGKVDFELIKTGIYRFLKRIPVVSKFIDEKTFGQFLRYVITGLTSFTLEYLLFTLLYVVLGVWYILANTIVYVIIFVFNFTLNRVWAFKSKARLDKQLLAYGLLFIFNLLSINVLLYLLSDIAGINPLISKVLVMAAVVCWNFVLYKKFIYK